MAWRRACLPFAMLLALAALTPHLAPAPAAAQRFLGPLRIVLLVDSSSAVSPMINQFRAGLTAFVDELPEGPDLALVTTGGQIHVRVPPTADRVLLKKEIAQFTSDGGGNTLIDTMLEADRRFMKTAPERTPVFVLVMTDLRTSSNELRAEQYNAFLADFMRRHGRAHGVVINGVNMGLTTDIVMNLTKNTGGFYEAMSVPNALTMRMKQMAANVAADIQ